MLGSRIFFLIKARPEPNP